MSLVFTRERGASKVPFDILQIAIEERKDGWAIAFVNPKTEHIHIKKSLDMGDFIETFREKEEEDCKMMIFLNTQTTGDRDPENRQPFSIEDEGLLCVLLDEDLDLTMIPGVSEADLRYSQYKSHETLIADIFRGHCSDNPHLTPYQKWSSFIRSPIMIPGIRLVYMINEESDGVETGTIVYSDYKGGILQDKYRIWFSDTIEKDYNMYEPEEESYKTSDFLSDKAKEIIESLDNCYPPVKITDLEGLNVRDMAYLAANFAAQMAEIIKYKISGYDENAMINSRVILEEDEPYCFDCNTPVDKSKRCVRYTDVTLKLYFLCMRCYKDNGLCKTQKLVH